MSLTLQDKLAVARRLDELGFDYVEGGWPGSNPKDEQFFAAIAEERLRHARVTAFGSTRRRDVRAEDDANLRLLVEARTPAVALVAKSWDFQVRQVLHTSLEENLAMIADSVGFLKGKGREVILDAEHFFDGYRAEADYALATLAAAAEAGADWLVLCDTNGGSLPGQIADAVARAVRDFGPRIGIHAHNDGELAVANSLAAVGAGAGQVQGTVNGYGERTGNANLCSILPTLVLKLGVDCEAGRHLDRLTDLSRFLDDVAHVAPNPRLPYVGAAAFAHKGGIHVHAVASDPATYEHVDPARVGNERRILVSELSGRSNALERARELGVQLEAKTSTAIAAVLRVKELENLGFKFEDAEASFELVLRRADDRYRSPFEPVDFSVELTHAEGAPRARAQVEVAVEGESVGATADADASIPALEQALRRALAPHYPCLEDVSLTEYRVHVLEHRAGTASPVRIRLCGIGPDGLEWATVGSSTSIVEAGWLALVDSLEYAVVKWRESQAPRPEAALR